MHDRTCCLVLDSQSTYRSGVCIEHYKHLVAGGAGAVAVAGGVQGAVVGVVIQETVRLEGAACAASGRSVGQPQHVTRHTEESRIPLSAHGCWQCLKVRCQLIRSPCRPVSAATGSALTSRAIPQHPLHVLSFRVGCADGFIRHSVTLNDQAGFMASAWKALTLQSALLHGGLMPTGEAAPECSAMMPGKESNSA